MPTRAPTHCTICHKAHTPACTQPRPDHKKLYDLRAWKTLRAYHLAQQPLCADCLASKKTTAASQVHHVKAHKGDLSLFLDTTNLLSLCASCHSIRTNRGE